MNIYLVEDFGKNEKVACRYLSDASKVSGVPYRTIQYAFDNDGFYFKGRISISEIVLVNGKKKTDEPNDGFDTRYLAQKGFELTSAHRKDEKSEESRNFSLEDAVKKNNEKLKKKKEDG